MRAAGRNLIRVLGYERWSVLSHAQRDPILFKQSRNISQVVAMHMIATLSFPILENNRVNKPGVEPVVGDLHGPAADCAILDHAATSGESRALHQGTNMRPTRCGHVINLECGISISQKRHSRMDMLPTYFRRLMQLTCLIRGLRTRNQLIGLMTCFEVIETAPHLTIIVKFMGKYPY